MKKYSFFSIAFASLLLMSGCAQYGISDRVTNSAITGAAIGAATSAMTGGNSHEILKGAAVGGAVGAAGAALTEPQ